MRLRHSHGTTEAEIGMNPKSYDPLLRREELEFTTSNGEHISVEAVFQDTMPSGSNIGTVVAIHGAPGSYKDFKYVTPLLQEKGIRLIGVNMPGYGLTPGDPLLRYDNFERNNFIHELIKRVGIVERLVVLGHSRGTENATGVAARNVEKLVGLVLLNPTGLTPHRVMHPRWIIPFVLWLYSRGPTAQMILHGILKFVYNRILGLRLDSGERAVICLKTMQSLEFGEGLRPHINDINRKPNARVLISYSGKDFLIETRVSQELVNTFEDCVELSCQEKDDSFEESAIQQTRDLFLNGAKTVSIYFEKDGHFLQRDRARYVANSIEAILLASSVKD
ncbi:hypothetical protein DICVIV_08650 [Dictyocaulus viviparus]|uniref:Hydrolase, alpha/beta domain protein n=1 Tax=Dictyocaulus viviparus TaxID=29172 RepID=A0A0D8XL12_DICVI|nr:hypothetical protein DICVIV_08650 [Dictyocaulus viviparus]